MTIRKTSSQPTGLLLFVHIATAVVATLGVAAGVRQYTHSQWFFPGIALLLLGAAAVYTFDRIDRAPLRNHPRCRNAVLVLIIASLVYCGVIVISNWQHLWLATLIAGPPALLHPFSRRIPLLKSLLIGLCWALACMLIPLHFHGDQYLLWQLLALVALIVTSAAILCDFKDMASDRQARIITLPLLLGPGRSQIVVALALLIASAYCIAIHAYSLAATSAALVACAGNLPLLQRPYRSAILIDASLCLPLCIELAYAF